VVVYSALFGTGYLLYGETVYGIVCISLAAVSAVGIFRALPHVGFD
jgi:hypothetical protein